MNSKERIIFDFEKGGSGLNQLYLQANEDDLLEFILCVLQKDKSCIERNLNEKEFVIDCKFQDELGYIELSISLLKVDEETVVIDFQKTSGPIMNYYAKIKKLKEEYL